MKRISLTFDNGPIPGVTERVLEILDKHAVLATFMVVGKNLEHPAGQALLAETAAAGHWIGNHTLTHSIALGDNPEPGYATHEISRTQELIGAHAHPEKFFRPFGNAGLLGPHLLSEEAVEHLQRNAYTCLLWNSIPRDWVEGEDWVARAVEHVQAQDWTVAVLHDMPGASVGRLDEFLVRMRDMDVRIEQTLPDPVLPIRRGKVAGLPDEYVAGRAGR